MGRGGPVQRLRKEAYLQAEQRQGRGGGRLQVEHRGYVENSIPAKWSFILEINHSGQFEFVKQLDFANVG